MKKFIAFVYARPLLAYIIVLCSFAFFFSLIWKAIPKENRDLVALAMGYLLARVGEITAYYFGSSKDKSDADQQTIFKNNTPP